MKVLAIAPLGATHLSAMFPTCWALRLAGHDVLVACSPDLASAVHGAGLPSVEIGAAEAVMNQISSDTSADWFPVPQFGERDTEMGRYLWTTAAAPQVTYANERFADYLAFARSWQPDLLLHDPTALIGRLLGGVLDLPSVAHRWGVDPTAGPFEEAVQRDLAPLYTSYGLTELPAPQLILDPCPPALQVADAPRGEHIAYVPFNGTGSVPDWVREPTGRRRVCVCMGSTVLEVAGVKSLRAVIDALADADDLDVVLAVTANYRSKLGEIPDRFRVVESLPLSLFLDTCSAIVDAGGSGTGLTAVTMGIPQLVLPQWFDQFDFAAGLVASGAGTSLVTPAEQADLDRIRDGLRAVLDDPSYLTAAEQLRADWEKTALPLPHVVPMLEKLVR
ncbi:MAG TPA: nucleotide disphospho-sugar-binding domain-containing protein [Pseudonocardiaceae bacterium]|nr:nucleotide disphospho-sugar-binding domain-containing protein [Pseudonocardiaceae bacterium]